MPLLSTNKVEERIDIMKLITVDGKEYKLEYSFMAVEHKETVQKMFDVLSGAYMIRKAGIIEDGGGTSDSVANAMLDGTGEMVADIPHIVKTAFYSGLLENHGVSESEAYEIMKAYMKENKISFKKLFDDIKECMEDDGFFDLSGLMDMLTEMEATMTEMEEEKPKKTPKTPQDHKKKSAGTK